MYFTKEEIEVISSRVLILQQFFPDYSGQLNLALEYSSKDPSSSLLKTRQILEDLFVSIWIKIYEEPPSSLADILKDPEIKSTIPSRLLNKIHSLRTMSNLGVHGHDVTAQDAYTNLNLLFEVLNWYQETYVKGGELPVPVVPPHSFRQYLKESSKDFVFWLILFGNTLFSIAVIRYHRTVLDGANISLKRVYEGVFAQGIGPFNGLAVTLAYSIVLVAINALLAWLIFKRFRTQDRESRVLSLELMFALVFSTQFMLLTLLDKFTNLF